MASIFSKIVKGEIPSYKVAEDEHYYAFSILILCKRDIRL